MALIAVLISAPNAASLAYLASLDGVDHVAVPSHKWQWAKPVSDAGFPVAPLDLDRQSMPFGYDEIEFTEADKHAAAATDGLIAALPAPISETVSGFAPALRRWFKQLLGSRFRYALAIQKYAATHNHAPIMLLDPNARYRDLHESLKLLGVDARAMPAPSATSQKISPPPAQWHEELSDAIAQAATQWGHLTPRKDSYVVLADLRNRQDFRHREMAIGLIHQLSRKQGPVHLLQTGKGYTRVIYKLYADLLWRTRRPVLLTPIKPPSKLHQPNAGIWAAPLADAACGLPTANQTGGQSPGFEPIKRHVLHNFAGKHLPAWLAIGTQLQAGFTAQPPKAVVSVPGHTQLAILATNAARLAGIPSFDIHTLLQTSSSRLAEPLADHMAVLDQEQAKIYQDRFDTAQICMQSFGPPFNRQWSKQVAKHQAKKQPGQPLNILFPTQPIRHETEQALTMLLRAMTDCPEYRLTISIHPDESPLARHRYHQAIDASGLAARITIHDGATSTAAVTQADVIVTVCSNVGYRGAIAGVPTIAIILDQPDTLRFDKSGIAIGAADHEQLSAALRSLAHDDKARSVWQERRMQFIQDNNIDPEVDSVVPISNWIAHASIKPAKTP